MADISKAMKYMLLNEGGFVNNPHDPGGATMKGVTLHTFQAFKGRACSVAELKAISDADLEAIYKHGYWDACGLDKCKDQSVATAVFDMSVNFGPGEAKLLANKAGAYMTAAAEDYIPDFEYLVEEHYYGIVAARPASHVFLKGWLARANRMLSLPC